MIPVDYSYTIPVIPGLLGGPHGALNGQPGVIMTLDRPCGRRSFLLVRHRLYSTAFVFSFPDFQPRLSLSCWFLPVEIYDIFPHAVMHRACSPGYDAEVFQPFDSLHYRCSLHGMTDPSIHPSPVQQIAHTDGSAGGLPSHCSVKYLHENCKLDDRKCSHPTSDDLLILLQRPENRIVRFGRLGRWSPSFVRFSHGRRGFRTFGSRTP